ncbi:glycosyltransferase family 2 protein [Desulfopila sp. IMCC35008]|uniref:glycosyltransferase family 2 protein n=1 Tax=Desulfopila sp. IMCC35008 TaxID=2653858 RepID=UPI0013D10233|nr:glycosyltransferase family 2 protein [Desulfopila sp. IMCC35008]
MPSKLSTIKYESREVICSVCIANYNGVNYLSDCIESVLMQEFDEGQIEIIVHDDASEDNSVDYIRTNYPFVRLIESASNVGFCVSNNRMVSEAKGKCILLLNNDAVLNDDAILTLYAAWLEYGEGIYGLPQYDATSGKLIDMGSTFDLFLNPVPNLDSSKHDVGMVTGACLWLSKSLWENLGGFPDWFGSLAEDTFICCYARLRGFPVKVVPGSGYDHWVGANFGGGKLVDEKKLVTSIERRSLSERNKSYVMVLSYPTIALIVILPIHILFLMFEGLLLSIIKKDIKIFWLIYWNCVKCIWSEKGRLIKRRKLIHRISNINAKEFFRPFSMFPYKLHMIIRFGIPAIR